MIIGISGVAGSGKDTLADMLATRGCVKVALADPIKRMVRDTFDFSWSQMWGSSGERNALDKRYPREHSWHYEQSRMAYSCLCCGAREPSVSNSNLPAAGCYLSPRYALQTLGTEWGRHVYQNVWVDHLIRTADAISSGVTYSQTYGLDQCAPELNESRERTIVVPDVRFKNEIDALRVAKAYLIRIVRPGAGLGGSHTSETEQSGIPNSAFDMVVDNSGSLEDLKTIAAQIYEGVIRGGR